MRLFSARRLAGRRVTKRKISAVCRVCYNEFRGRLGSNRCPRCRKEDERHKVQREKLKKNLPFYLKTWS
jgi:Zn finger protein HypA/HybF involved in hydrogenase expression